MGGEWPPADRERGGGGSLLGLAGAAGGAAAVVLASGAGAAAWVVRRGHSGAPAAGEARQPPGPGGGAAGAAGAAEGTGFAESVGTGLQKRALPVALRALQLSTAGMLGVGAMLGVAVLALGLKPKQEAILSAEGVLDLFQETYKTLREDMGAPVNPNRPAAPPR